MIRKLPPVEYLKECFLYEPLTGKLYWRERPQHHFSKVMFFIYWNKRWAGKEAFYTSPKGRVFGMLDGKYCAAHRVIWKLMTGKEPPTLIDHKDRNPTNNKWTNLRVATKSQNCVNRDIDPRNTSGYGGVHKHKNNNRWVAQLGARSQKRYLGIFDSPEKARAVWLAKAKKVYGEDFLPCA